MQPDHHTRRVLFNVAILALLMAVLSACQSTGAAFFATTIPSDSRIPLQPNGPHQGEADTGELVVAYVYQLGPEPHQEIHVKGGIRSLKLRGDAVNVYLNFLDNAGGVIKKQVLYGSDYRRSTYFRRPSTFDTTLPVPPGTVAIAFSSFVKPSAGRR